MDIEQTKAAIEVMQAYVNGVPVQFRPECGTWSTANEGDMILWDWSRYEYRIKPRKPATVNLWVVEKTGEVIARSLENVGTKGKGIDACLVTREFKEVMP